MKKKILFIIQSYPSEMSANVLCDDKLMQTLRQTDPYEIHALTYRYNFQPKEEQVQGIHVHRFSRGPLWDMYTWARHQKNHWRTWLIFKLTRFLLRLQQVVTIPFYPFTEPWALWLYARQAAKLHQQEHFDLVIAEHNGLDTLMAGYLLKKKFPKIKFMPIFWDPLSGAIAPKYLPQAFSRRRCIKMEKKILQHADCAIVMQAHYPLLKQLYGNTSLLHKIRVLDLPSFGKPVQTAAKSFNFAFNKDKIYLCFAGTLGGRNIESFCQLLAGTNLKNVELLVVSGNSMKERVEQLAKQVPFPIHFMPYMPHGDLMQLLENMHILINLGVDSNTMVASKIFEYMSFGKPLIDTYLREDDANLPYLKKYPLSFLVDERQSDNQQQAQALRQFIEQNAHKRVAYEQIAPLFYKNTPDAYAQQIKELLEETA